MPNLLRIVKRALKAMVAKDYAVRLKCPFGDTNQLLTLRNCEETLEQVLSTAWHFECPVHGVQRELPMGAREIIFALGSKTRSAGMTAAGKFKVERRTTRLPLRVPLLVYGRNRKTTIREETATNLVNAHGGLIALAGWVQMGEKLVVVNKTTQEEQECRVTYIGPKQAGERKVGIAFLRSSPNFWGLDFPPSR
jgi:hypothetical protein